MSGQARRALDCRAIGIIEIGWKDLLVAAYNRANRCNQRLFLLDFPEISAPAAGVSGAPARRLQFGLRHRKRGVGGGNTGVDGNMEQSLTDLTRLHPIVPAGSQMQSQLILRRPERREWRS